MSAFDDVQKLANEWQPELCATELKYRDSLVRLLRERLKAATIETECRHSGTTVDIYVKQPSFFGETEVFVELKRDMLQKSQLDRLVGQMESLRPDRNKIIVILCGETSPALLQRFKEKYGLTSDFFTRSDRTVIVKQSASAATTEPTGRKTKTSK